MQLMNRPDFSNYLVHFTSEGDLKGNNDGNPVVDIVSMTAQERLISILRNKKLGHHRCRGLVLTQYALQSARGQAYWLIQKFILLTESDFLKIYFCKAWWTSDLYPSRSI